MIKLTLLFDASNLLTLIRELRGRAPDLFSEGSTISLAYYEVGNALWRECFLLQRIDPKEASQLLTTVFAILGTMDVAFFEDEELGNAVLKLAGELKITYYDASYITEAQKSKKILVTDDEKLIKAAESVGVKTLTSKTVSNQRNFKS